MKNKHASHFLRWIEHPDQMVRELFDVEPDDWQLEALQAFPHRKRLAMKANKGPGKSTVLAWLIWNFMLRRDANVMVTSITGDNLKDGVWKELAKWYAKAPLLKELFIITGTRIESRDPELAKNWFASARTWPKTGTADEQSNALAGFHSEYCLGVIDEAGGVPDAVMAAVEAILAGGTETRVVIAGNPTHREGPLFRACTSERSLWKIIEITGDPDDPKRAKRVPIEWAREQIQKYGRDNPYVLVNVFGQFPPFSFNALIGDDEIREAMRRSVPDWHLEGQATLLGVDVARQGDDFSCIARRKGRQAYNFQRRRNIESGQLGASLVNRLWTEFDADACFLDATGGFGDAWYDPLVLLHRSPVRVYFNGKSSDVAYYNKRAQMYFELVQWIKNGGCLPMDESDSPGGAGYNFIKALSNTTYTHRGDQLILEDKDDIKAKIGFSPDEVDSLALTFAEPIKPKPKSSRGVLNVSAVSAYRPFSDLEKMQGQNYTVGSANGPYDPFRR